MKPFVRGSLNTGITMSRGPDMKPFVRGSLNTGITMSRGPDVGRL